MYEKQSKKKTLIKLIRELPFSFEGTSMDIDIHSESTT